MTPTIDMIKTGQRIKMMMKLRGLSVQNVSDALSLACVQSVYHWLHGRSLPTLDNLYSLSELLQVPMDLLVVGNHSNYRSRKNNPQTQRLLQYCIMLLENTAA